MRDVGEEIRKGSVSRVRVRFGDVVRGVVFGCFLIC